MVPGEEGAALRSRSAQGSTRARSSACSKPSSPRLPATCRYAVRDLNEDPSLPYEDNSFDMITNAGQFGTRRWEDP